VRQTALPVFRLSRNVTLRGSYERKSGAPWSRKSRRHFTPEQKAAIVRRHLVDKVPVSDLCDEYTIQPSMLYTWQKAVVDGAARVFEAPAERAHGSSRESELSKRIEQLEAKLAT
jgi:transposase